jgi:hypothetical protein
MYNNRGIPLRAVSNDMTKLARLALLFILHNVRPKSHLSDINMPVLELVHCLFARIKVDVAKIISDEMKVIALSGVSDQSKTKCLLAYPALIMGLIENARLYVPANSQDKLVVINDKHVERHCKPKETTSRASSHSTDQQLFYHLMDQNAANHRAYEYMYEAMYKMSLNQPLYDPSSFSAHVAWPGDRPHSGEGAGTSAGANDGGDDDPIDQAAVDAYADDDDTIEG